MAEIRIARMEARKDTIYDKLTGGKMSDDCGVGEQEGRQLPKGKERLPAVSPGEPKANKCRTLYFLNARLLR